jgi:hypothetical protein
LFFASILSMNELKLCPSCQHQNVVDATVCEKCASPLVALLPARITVRVPEELLATTTTPEPPKRTTQPFDDKMALYIVGRSEPVLINPSVMKVLLGRTTPGELEPTVDLTQFDAHLFGVSRQHAILFRTENGCFLQDLESTNGTWLNEKKLQPKKLYEVNSGDLIRLGQLGMRPYFETANTEFVLTLIDEVQPGQRLTPGYLEQRVSPYLVALANAQQMIDAMQDRPLSTMTIKAMATDEDGHVQVTVSGARDILRLQDSRFAEWRTRRMILVEQLRQLNERVRNEGDPKGELRTKSEPIRQNMRAELTLFARECTDAIAPQLSEVLRQTYAEKLAGPMQALLFSPLQPLRDGAVEKEKTP